MNFIRLFTLLIILAFSCKKNATNTEPELPSNKIPAFPLRVTEQIINSSILKKYSYTNNNRIKQISTYENEELIEQVNYTYTGNTALVNSTKNKNQYTYFLNSKGLADSCEILLPGYAYIKKYYFYSNTNKLIQAKEIGSIVSVPYEQTTFYYYSGDTLISEKVITADDPEEFHVDYEYINSIINPLQGTDFLSTFLPASKYLVTKIVYNKEEESSFTYTNEGDTILHRNDALSSGTSLDNTFILERINK